ncbi:hypothetical protein EVAR_76375_1 [Eumeta japonica]|uniref:Uncharacterized protein n=1 Tax=Eumeta variegata TaxID=151549 RepID=A0A4C1TAM0_EUMVA|nr:hypothetical protein EVAR_76375_1 [Eumeta japonica]
MHRRRRRPGRRRPRVRARARPLRKGGCRRKDVDSDGGRRTEEKDYIFADRFRSAMQKREHTSPRRRTARAAKGEGSTPHERAAPHDAIRYDWTATPGAGDGD